MKSTTQGTLPLQTASCMAVNRSNSIPVRVFFHNGSQESYVSIIKSVNSENFHINTFVHLEGLELTDDFDNTESINVLIGSDYYWDFVSGDPIKGDQDHFFGSHSF